MTCKMIWHLATPTPDPSPQGGGELGFIMHLARDKVKVLTTMMCESDSGEDREPIDQRDGSVGYTRI